MSVPPPTPSLDQLAHRPFSFYPAIVNVEHNEWVFRRATWSEILVGNTRGEIELWIPRRYLGEISSVEDPVMIVGLSKELEYKAGTVWPHERQVIEMPRLGPETLPPPEPAAGPAPIVAIRTERSAESRIGRLIAAVLIIGVAGFVLLVMVVRIGPMRTRTVFTNKDQAYLLLNRQDDYFTVLSKLGQPGEDRWRPHGGELQYRLLGYPDRGYSAILMGPERASARYIGTMDREWHVLHYVEVPGGGSTRSMMRGLGRF